MIRTSVLIVAAAVLLPAQQAPQPQPVPRPPGVNYVQRVYRVQHADIGELYRLVATRPGAGQSPVFAVGDSLRVITVFGTETEVNSIMENLKALDVPASGTQAEPRSVEITMHILIAAQQGDLPGSPVPDLLAPVTAELSRALGPQQFRLLETGIVRTRVGGRGVTSNGAAGALGRYNLALSTVQIAGRSIALSDIRFILQGSTDNKELMRIATSVDLEAGKSLVIGKTGIDESGRSVVLVFTGRLPE